MSSRQDGFRAEQRHDDRGGLLLKTSKKRLTAFASGRSSERRRGR